jgi:hypothetical protein
MRDEPRIAFDSIEDAHQYIGMLAEVVSETQDAIQQDIDAPGGKAASRRVETLYVVMHKLQQLGHQLRASSRTLNDLRTLRRLLLEERGGDDGSRDRRLVADNDLHAG